MYCFSLKLKQQLQLVHEIACKTMKIWGSQTRHLYPFLPNLHYPMRLKGFWIGVCHSHKGCVTDRTGCFENYIYNIWWVMPIIFENHVYASIFIWRIPREFSRLKTSRTLSQRSQVFLWIWDSPEMCFSNHPNKSSESSALRTTYFCSKQFWLVVGHGFSKRG